MDAQRTRTTARRRTVGALGVGALAVALIAAVAPPASGATGAAARCSTADLAVRLRAGSPAAGQRYATVVLTDTGGRTCTVGGYGGLALLGAPGQGVPTDLR